MSDRRLLKDTSIEIRKLDDEQEEMHISGKAVAFESPETYWGETEIIDTHALDECDMSDVVLRYNHNDTQYTLARTRNNSLKLEIRDDGLYFDADLIDTTTNKDAYKMIKAGLLDKCSFAFTIEEYDYNEKERVCRIMKIGKMFDVAVVDFPFYNDTSVEARSFDNRSSLMEQIKEEQEKKYQEKKAQVLYDIKRKELLKKLG